jgi:hypothetical protein
MKETKNRMLKAMADNNTGAKGISPLKKIPAETPRINGKAILSGVYFAYPFN